MRLVIREYLSMLRESGELDVLLPDLLLAMGLVPLSRPARGARQYGVDIPAVGPDPEDGREKLFLVTAKQGDLTRTEWNGSPQAVRPSLDEILDSYLRTRVLPEHKTLPKTIVLATGGELKQDVEPDWVNFVNRHSRIDPDYGELRFEFWGGDKLAELIERFIVDEYLFPESAQKALRKTIALADQNEDEPRHFYDLIEATLFGRQLPTDAKPASRRKRQKALRLLNLSLSIVFHWCQEAGNLRPALLSAERVVLRTWDWMRQGDLERCRATRTEFDRLLSTYRGVGLAYATKLDPHCRIRDGLFGHGADELEYPLRTMETIGILGAVSMAFAYAAADADAEQPEVLLARADAVADTLAALVAHNPPALAPRYDEHATDISLGLLALVTLGYEGDAADWIESLTPRVVMAFQLHRYFPISSDAYDDLISLEITEGEPRQVLAERLMQLSTLLPTLAEWLAVLDMGQAYTKLRAAVATQLPSMNLQLWQPDAGTDGCLYRTNAAGASGFTLASIQLPAEMDRWKAKMSAGCGTDQQLDRLSCVAAGYPAIALIASRHFRTPMIPAFRVEMLAHGPDLPLAPDASLIPVHMKAGAKTEVKAQREARSARE